MDIYKLDVVNSNLSVITDYSVTHSLTYSLTHYLRVIILYKLILKL